MSEMTVSTPTANEKVYTTLFDVPSATPGFKLLEVTGKFADPDVAGKTKDYNSFVLVPSTASGIQAWLDEYAKKNGGELVDKEFSELTGVLKLAYDSLKLIFSRNQRIKMETSLVGPAIKIEKLADAMQKQNPKLSRAKAIATATMLMDESD